jgi:hypothetical protein
MAGWYAKNLGDALLAYEPQGRIEALFAAAYEQAGCPTDMALFIRHESEGRLHCEVKLYFSPAAAPLAKALNAVPCGRPSADSLGLLAGAEQCWRLLSGQQDQQESS